MGAAGEGSGRWHGGLACGASRGTAVTGIVQPAAAARWALSQHLWQGLMGYGQVSLLASAGTPCQYGRLFVCTVLV